MFQSLSQVNGVLQIDTTSNDSTFTMRTPIPKQTLTLERVRVECDTQAHALALGRIYIELDFINSAAVTNANNIMQNHSRILVLLDNNQVSLRDPQVHFDLKADIPNTFQVRIFDVNGNLAANINNVQMIFSYDYAYNG
jgi:hypothetical protein